MAIPQKVSGLYTMMLQLVDGYNVPRTVQRCPVDRYQLQLHYSFDPQSFPMESPKIPPLILPHLPSPTALFQH